MSKLDSRYTRARNENNRLADVGRRRRKTPSESTQRVNIMLRLDKGFCYLNRCQRACTTRAARSAAERGVRLARRPRRRLISLARRPPATPTPHSAPRPCTVHTTDRPSAPDVATAVATAAQPDRPPRIMHRTYTQFHNCNVPWRATENQQLSHSLKRRGNGLRNAAGSPDTAENNERQTNAEPF